MSERTTVRLPPELLRRAKRKAAAERRTLTELIEDGLRMVEFAMSHEAVRGALNVTAPVAATQGAFARAAAQIAGRRVLGRLRSRLLRRTLGVFSDIQDAAPAKALQEGFGHVHPTLQFWMGSREDPAPIRENA